MLLIMNKGPGKRIGEFVGGNLHTRSQLKDLVDLRDAPDTDKNDGLMEFDDLD